jgi:hypothetical protein
MGEPRHRSRAVCSLAQDARVPTPLDHGRRCGRRAEGQAVMSRPMPRASSRGTSRCRRMGPGCRPASSRWVRSLRRTPATRARTAAPAPARRSPTAGAAVQSWMKHGRARRAPGESSALSSLNLLCSVNDAVNVLPCATWAYLNGDPLLTWLPFQDDARFPVAIRLRIWRRDSRPGRMADQPNSRPLAGPLAGDVPHRRNVLVLPRPDDPPVRKTYSA